MLGIFIQVIITSDLDAQQRLSQAVQESDLIMLVYEDTLHISSNGSKPLARNVLPVSTTSTI